MRRIEFLRPLSVSTLCQRRGEFAPYGVAGGDSGKLGKNTIQYADGTREELPGCAQLDVNAGDVLTLETPGGGGYGVKDCGSQ